jgi:WS/DGAT/MGAT family acyltransferase
MTGRLSAVDVSFLYLEGSATPMHLGTLAIFGPPARQLTYESLVNLIEQRINLAPRYRQKIVGVPGRLANPVWVDDPDFDVAYHVRRSGLPRPGTDEQLREFCARIQSRPLDRRRPLWEMYLIEGLADDRVAVATKTHYALVDGVSAIDLEQVLLDAKPGGPDPVAPLWMPRPAPTSGELVIDAVAEIVRRPSAVLDAVRLGLGDARVVARQAGSVLGGTLSAVRLVTARPHRSPLNVRVAERRRFATVATSLADLREIHRDQGVSVNDVVLATVAGALRAWLLLRGEAVQQTTTVRALVPISVHADGGPGAPDGIAPMFVDLPIGEPSPLVRLSQIGFGTREAAQSAHAVGAQALAALGGFAPPTLHAMAARAAGGLSRQLFNLVIANVPGPQSTLFGGGVALSEIYPIVPLVPGQALAVGVTSYDGGVYFGLNADYEAMGDLDMLAGLVEASLAELVTASEQARTGTRRRRRLATVTQVRSGRARTETAP